MKRHIASVLVSFTAILLCGSCAKIDTTNIGSGLLPEVDNINTFETVLDVVTDNKLFDDTTRMLYSEYHALGIIDNDAEFGRTNASVYASFTPTVYKFYPFLNRDSVTVDSVVLSLAYIRSYGDSSSIEKFNVREIQPGTSFTDSLYFLHSPDFPTNPEILGSASVMLSSLKDTITYRNGKDTVRTGNELRIHLDTSFARRFIAYDTSGAYSNDTAFKTVFKGLQITADEASPSKNALAYFNLDDNSHTRITFYCRAVSNGATDTIAPVFTYTSDPHANLIKRTPGNNYLANISNGTPNDERLYIQSSPGSYATVKIPGLDTMGNRLVHRAELILDKAPSAEDFYNVPGALFIDAISSGGDSVFTIRNDFIPTGTTLGYDQSALGGVFRNNQYVLLLTRYVQSIVTRGFPNYTLRIHAPFYTRPFYMDPNTNTVDAKNGKPSVILNTPVATGRVVLFGGGASDPKRTRLRIIYSRI